LLVHPNGAKIIYQDLYKTHSAFEPPIWCGLIANHLRVNGINVQILDCEVEGLSANEAATIIKNINAKLTVLVIYGQQPSASAQNMQGAHDLLEELNWSVKTLLVGLYPSAVSRKCLIDEKVDFVCQGEGPKTISALWQTDLMSENQLSKVPGLWFRNKQQILFTKPEPPISQNNLSNELPGIAWDLLPMKKYRTSNWHALSNNNQKQPFASIYTSLGCPYACNFCCINAPFGNNNVENSFGKPSYRYWDSDFVINELEVIADLGITNLKIADELFVLKKEHYINLCNKIIEKNFNFNIWAYSRINTIDEGHLETLKRAGVNWLALGIESGDTQVRKGSVKGTFKDVDIVKTVRQIQNAGINVIGNFIFGLPDDTIDTMQITLDLAKELNCEFANFYSAMAYPGSSLYLQGIKNNWRLPQTYSAFSQHSYDCTPLDSKFCKAEEILKFRDFAFNEYFTNQTYLDMIKNKFGIQSYEEIKTMTNIKLKRKILGD